MERLAGVLPDTATLDVGELAVGGVRASGLVEEFGTPLVVYCEETLRARARAYREAAPDALVVYGAKAFPNVALMRLFAEEGLGVDVSTLGELSFARRAGLGGEAVVFHGNNKSDAELAAAAAGGALVVLDAPDEPARAAAAGVRRALLRLKPAVEAVTHPSIRTAHEDSKFGFSHDQALEALRDPPLEIVGVHVHIGSQLTRLEESRLAVDRIVSFCGAAGWTPEIVNLGGGLGVAHTGAEAVPSPTEFVQGLLEPLTLPSRVILEPGRSLIGRAGVTLYGVGVVKERAEATDVAIDGGMSDNPRPQLYGARYTALVANRADDEAVDGYRVVGKHCESGDVLIERVALAPPSRGDILAVPATGAYTLGMASNYNGVPRPAAVLVRDGDATLIRRRETVEDLLSWEP